MRNVFLLAIGMFTLGFDAYIVAGLLPDMSATFHISDSQSGQAVSIFTLCYALAAPIFATLLAGKPIRTVLVLAFAVFTVANGASALATNYSFLLISRAAAGIGAGLFSPLASTAAASLVAEQKRGRALGITLGGMSIGTVMGVPLGLIVANEVGWQGAFWIIAVMGFITTIGMMIFFPDFSTEAPPSLRQRVAMMTNKNVLAIIGITFLASIASLGLYTYIASVLKNLEGIHSITPYLWAWALGGVIGSLSIGNFIDRTGRPALLMVGILAILSVGMFSLPYALAFPIFAYFPIFIWGAMGWASVAPQQHALLHTQPRHGKVAVALNSSANYLGGAIGAALGGMAMAQGLSSSHLPFAAGFLVFIALLGQWIILRKQND
ncbi:putative MFS family arabinose efflux permease [Bacillus thermophilus]|uniref:MFS family arabinose efflux permease n=1 Tax=Siminovitchia thermophila TaxID=1245522 RepID=A0ABS2R1X4_9BACI|nr:MFS transporter [Siminovitchia thermophila]MBM7713390.1 putative MFS family arabinose efflux permease [Siminovitchia thermophila]